MSAIVVGCLKAALWPMAPVVIGDAETHHPLPAGVDIETTGCGSSRKRNGRTMAQQAASKTPPSSACRRARACGNRAV